MVLKRLIKGVCLGAALGAMLASTGCVTRQVVPLGERSGAAYGGFKLYSTDNVPFEYEELGFLSQKYHHSQCSSAESIDQFIASARQQGADAVLNFRLDTEAGCGGFFLVVNPVVGWWRLTGVAVKIKRP